MGKFLSCLALALLCAAGSFSQTNQMASGFSRGTIKYNGVEYPCYERSFTSSVEVVETAINEKMKARGFKGDSKKGFKVYRNISVPEFNNGDKVDVFTKVEPEGKKGEARAKLLMIVTKPGEVTDDKPSKDAATAAGVGVGLVAVSSGFHDEMHESVTAGHHNAELKTMQEELRKQERNLADLQSERKILEKRLEKAQKDLDDNAKEINSKKDELEKQRKLVEAKAAAAPLGIKKN